MKKLPALLLLVALALVSCEKDDICDGGASSTPRVVIEFFDIADPSESKNVIDLKVVGTGMETPLVFNETATDDRQYLANTNKIAVPLRTTDGNTEYAFIFNADATDPTQTFTDTIDFNYITSEVYVSRACGFKKEFDFLPGTDPLMPPVMLNNDPNAGSGSWIQDIRVVQYHIEDETETHVYIMY